MNFQTKKFHFIRDHAKIIRNIGSGRDDFRAFFAGLDYKNVDIDEKVQPDIIADAHDLPIEDGTVDAVTSFSLIEHTHSPHLVVDEMYRILRPGGYVLLSVPFIHPYHGGNCPDYYRFTKDGLKYLFRNFSSVEIQSDGGVFFALQFFIPPSLGFTGVVLRPLFRILDMLFTRRRSSAHALAIFAQK